MTYKLRAFQRSEKGRTMIANARYRDVLRGKRFRELRETINAFCPTGEGGGVDPTCSPRRRSRSETDSPEFKRWFGKSAAVGPDGSPQKVYRGSKHPDSKPPIFLTVQRSGAEEFAEMDDNGKVYEGYVRIENPLDLGLNEIEPTKRLIKLARSVGVKVKWTPGWDNFSCKEIGEHSPFEGTSPQDLVYIPKVREALKAAGYDGIVLEDQFMGEGLYRTYIAFDSDQVRLKPSKPTTNAFCPTGPGGGVDPTCSPSKTKHAGPVSVSGMTSNGNFVVAVFDEGHDSNFHETASDFAGYGRLTPPPGLTERNMVGVFSVTRQSNGSYNAGVIEVHRDFRRRGIATRLYDLAEKVVGQRINPSDLQTVDMREFWKARSQTTNARRKPANPLRLDPSHTGPLRRRFEADMARRFDDLKKRLWHLVVEEDALGLRGTGLSQNAFCPTGEGGGVDPTCSPGQTVKAFVYEGTLYRGGKVRKDESGTFGAGWYFTSVRDVASAYAQEARWQREAEGIDPGEEQVYEYPQVRADRLLQAASYDEVADPARAAYKAKHGKNWGSTREQAQAITAYWREQGYAGISISEHGQAGTDTVVLFDRPTFVGNAFCPTGEGGGRDNSCSPSPYVNQLLAVLNGDCGTGAGGFKPGNTCAKGSDPYKVAGVRVVGKFSDLKNVGSRFTQMPMTGRIGLIMPDGTLLDTEGADHEEFMAEQPGLFPPSVRDLVQSQVERGVIRVTQEGDTLSLQLSEKKYSPLDVAEMVSYGKLPRAKTYFIDLSDGFVELTLDQLLEARSWKHAARLAGNQFTANAGRWAFLTSSKRLEEFVKWFKLQLLGTVLAPVHPDLMPSDAEPGESWLTRYIRQAYKKALETAHDLMKPTGVTMLPEAAGRMYQAGGKAQFMRQAFNGPAGIERLRQLAGRAYDDLDGISTDLSNKIGRQLLDGMVKGESPRAVGRRLNKMVDGYKNRGLAIARTETLRAHNEGQLDALEALGATHVGAQVEWSTSGLGMTGLGNPSPCPLCAELQGVVLTLQEARGLLPRHPNCFIDPLTRVWASKDGGTTQRWTPISQIEEGYHVLTHRGNWKPVIQVHRNLSVSEKVVRIFCEGAPDPLEVTASHPVYRGYETWVLAEDVRVGNTLLAWHQIGATSVQYLKVWKVEHRLVKERMTLWNLSVADDESYIVSLCPSESSPSTAGGYIVHNCMCAWRPANVGESTKGQIRRQDQIKRALERSLRLAMPKKAKHSLKEEAERATWPGGRARISKTRPKTFSVKK